MGLDSFGELDYLIQKYVLFFFPFFVLIPEEFLDMVDVMHSNVKFTCLEKKMLNSHSHVIKFIKIIKNITKIKGG